MATTTKTSAKEVLAAIYAALNVASITSTLGCKVFDDVPQSVAFPYLRISSPNAQTWDTFGAAGKQRTVTIAVFTQYSGQYKAIQICDQVIVLLEHVSLTIASHVTCGVQYETDGEGADEVIAGKRVEHRFVQFTVTVQES